MLSVTGSPQWRTVIGGSRAYVERGRKGLTACGPAPVRAVPRHADGVELVDADGERPIRRRWSSRPTPTRRSAC